MKKYPLFALVFFLLLLVGTAFGEKPRDEFPMCQSPCFWGFVYHIERYMHPPWQAEVPSAGATVELWFPDNSIATCQTDQLGGYCFYRSSWSPGDYVLKVACLEKHVYRAGNEDIRVEDFVFQSPCRVIPDPPVNPGVPLDPVPGIPQP